MPQRPEAPTAIRPAMTWYIGFCDFAGSGPLKAFVRPGFGHVFAFASAGHGLLVAEPVAWGLSLKYLPRPAGRGAYPADVLAAEWLATTPRLTLLRVRVPRMQVPTARHLSFALPTCVSVVKAVLGLRAWAVTPWQLYRVLLKAGAVPVTPNWCAQKRRTRVRHKAWRMARKPNPYHQKEQPHVTHSTQGT